MTGLGLAFSITLLLGGLVGPSAAGAQPAAKVARIGYLSVNLAAAPPHMLEAFRQGLRDLGYVEGRNVVIEYRDAAGKPERLPALAAELIALKVDVIMAGSTPHALAAKQATSTIPIVFALADEPVELGLVSSLAKPGGNITGLTGLMAELTAKRLALLKEMAPRIDLSGRDQAYTLARRARAEAEAREALVRPPKPDVAVAEKAA